MGIKGSSVIAFSCLPGEDANDIQNSPVWSLSSPRPWREVWLLGLCAGVSRLIRLVLHQRTFTLREACLSLGTAPERVVYQKGTPGRTNISNETSAALQEREPASTAKDVYKPINTKDGETAETYEGTLRAQYSSSWWHTRDTSAWNTWEGHSIKVSTKGRPTQIAEETACNRYTCSLVNSVSYTTICPMI